MSDNASLILEAGENNARKHALEIYQKLYRKEIAIDIMDFLLILITDNPIAFMETFEKAGNSINSMVIKTFKSTNNKIQAIKVYRDLTGYSLKTCKDNVEKILAVAGLLTL